ncbi:hypothetical protein CCUS01_05392 [Colletotrichum cuscutae]|uniref:Uncharacterized protein n=2 Tax=Colletotrichum acutatum species complex TaxID=2707335 RepID=A0AAI9VD14_9PEZI|nr:uncharacterized protein CTAM01_15208 [Colletotrichum tamarilloi]KAK1474767.1 hypothetical protein CCUS01_05392 [Colletotrichum cuscutae]KAK1477284.1 hypothetical protein CTAM01_15208 [Colletotrichum tamarilloi]KAK1708579.1 hypothetical protein BDP67DRAFT_525095 [Colletotrichum lupini]
MRPLFSNPTTLSMPFNGSKYPTSASFSIPPSGCHIGLGGRAQPHLRYLPRSRH